MKALWVGPEAEMKERVQLALQSRWPDARLNTAQPAPDIVDQVIREDYEVAFICLSHSSTQALTFINELRGESDIPILAVGGDPGTLDQVKALYQGADNIIKDDHGPMEIQAKTMAILRRAQGRVSDKEEMVQLGDLQISMAAHEVYLKGQPIHLTPTEFRLLYALVQRRGMVATHELLLRSVWGEGADGNMLRKYIQRLRVKLSDNSDDPRWIATVPAIGYRLLGYESEAATSYR